jgi:predicted ABC-type ATPase
MYEILDRRPIAVMLAGPNGAGKSTFYAAHLILSGLRFVNADDLSQFLTVDSYHAARVADAVRQELVQRGESFIFETVFSDPAGDKLAFLKVAEESGYTVVLFFIGIDGVETSEERIALRVAQGGHDVPSEKAASRYPRTMENLRRALIELKNIRVYDNSDLADPYRIVVIKEEGQKLQLLHPIPAWLKPLLPAK